MARVFIDLSSADIRSGGVPLCPEASSTFGIDNQQGTLPPATPAGNNGSYNLTITIPVNAIIGTYTTYASSLYNGLQASTSETTAVSQAGDFNGDGIVNVNDVTIFVIAYNNYWSHQPYNQLSDMNNDGTINVNDITLFVLAYNQFWSWY